MLKYILFGLLFLLSVACFAQKDTSKWVRAFPISNYMVDIGDSVKVVQVHLPGSLIKEKQLGVLRGVYKQAHSDTMLIGTGRCNLIKGDYYYFTINYKKSGKLPKENDLLYTFVARSTVYSDKLIKIALHFIELQNVYEKPLYDRYSIFNNWTRDDEKRVVDSIVADVQFTGDYFLKNNPSMNVKINGGKYNGKMVLNIMTQCAGSDITDFLDYIIARPRLYAGRQWKISELFATWLSNGGPTVVK